MVLPPVPLVVEPAAAIGRRRDRAAVERTLRTAAEPVLKADAGAMLFNANAAITRIRTARCGPEDVKERELLLRGGGAQAQAPARVVVEAFAVRRDFATPPAAFGAGMQAQK